MGKIDALSLDHPEVEDMRVFDGRRFAVQTVEDTSMVPITVNGRRWLCRAHREERFKLIYRSLMDVIALPGNIAEMGCWIGLTSAELARYAEDLVTAYFFGNSEDEPKALHCFESFEGLDEWDKSSDRDKGEWIALPDMERQFQANMEARRMWTLHKGHLSEMDQFSDPLCWAYVDVDIYKPTLDAITILKRCMVPGGIAVFDDYGADKWWPGVRKAVEETLGESDDWKLTRRPEDRMWLCFAQRMR